jgi:hypothetical protein
VSIGDYFRMDTIVGGMHHPTGYQLASSADIASVASVPRDHRIHRARNSRRTTSIVGTEVFNKIFQKGRDHNEEHGLL